MLSDRLTALLRNPETPTYVLRDAIAEEEPEVRSVWVVVGRTGECSDRREWMAAAYLDRDDAESCRDRLNEWCKDNQVHWETDPLREDHWDFEEKPPDDHLFRVDYTGTAYVVREIPLRVGVE